MPNAECHAILSNPARKLKRNKIQLAFELLECRVLLAYSNLGLVQAVDPLDPRPCVEIYPTQVELRKACNAEPARLLRFRLGTESWGESNTSGKPLGFGFGKTSFADAAGSSGLLVNFLSDTPISGDWTAISNSNVGTARWQDSKQDRINGEGNKDRTWNFSLSTDNDADVDYEYNFPLPFPRATQVQDLPVPLAGNIDGKFGDDLAVVDRTSDVAKLRWKMVFALSGPTIAYPDSISEEVSFGPKKDGKPVLGFYKDANGFHRPAIAVLKVTNSIASWSILYSDVNGKYATSVDSESGSQVLDSQISNVDDWQPIAGDFDADGKADLGIIQHRDGGLWLHTIDKSQSSGTSKSVLLVKAARPSDRIIVGNWAQVQWSVGVPFASKPLPTTYWWNHMDASPNDQAEILKRRFWAGTNLQASVDPPLPPSNVVIDSRYMGQIIENGMRFGKVDRQGSTNISGRVILLNGSKVFAGATNFSRMRIEAGDNTFSGETLIDSTRLTDSTSLAGAILAPYDVSTDPPSPYGNNPSQENFWGLHVKGGKTQFTGATQILQPVIVTSGKVEFAGTDTKLGTVDVRGENGVVTFSGKNSRVGAIVVADKGVVVLDSDTLTFSAPITLNKGGVLRVMRSIDLGTVTINGGQIEFNAGSLPGTTEIKVGEPGATLMSIAESSTVAFTYAGRITGTGDITKKGLGSLTLSGSSSFTGGIKVEEGTLKTGDANILPDSSDVTVSIGATLTIGDFNETIKSLTNNGTTNMTPAASGSLARFQITGDFVNKANAKFSGGAKDIQVDGFVTNSGDLDLQGSLLSTPTLSLTGGSISTSSGTGIFQATTEFTLESGTISVPLTGSGKLRKTGNGTSVDLRAANSFRGGIRVEQGTLNASADNALPSNSTVIVASNAIVSITNSSQTLSSITGDGTGSGTLSLVTGTVNLQVASPSTFPGAITGTGTLNKLGLSDWTLTGPNSFAGTTNITAGTLRSGAAETLSDSSDVTVSIGAFLEIGDFNETIKSLTNNGTTNLSPAASGSLARFRVTGDLLNPASATIIGGAKDIQVDGSVTNSSIMDLRGSLLSTPTLTLQSGTLSSSVGSGSVLAATALNLESGVVSVPLNGTAALTKTTAGSVQLQRGNSYSGATTITAGVLNVDADNAIPLATVATVRSPGQLLVTSLNNSIGSLENSGTVQLGGSTSRFEIAGLLNNQVGGTLNLGSGSVQLQSSFTNAGTLNAGSSTVELTGGADSLQRLSLAAGTVPGSLNNLNHLSLGNVQLDSDLDVAGTFQKSGLGALDVLSQSLRVNQLILNGGTIRGTTGTGRIVGRSNPFDLRQGAISAILTGEVGINKTTVGTVELSQPSVYQRATSIQQGVLAVSGADAIPLSSPVTIASGATLSLVATSQRLESVGGSGVISLSSGALNLVPIADLSFAGTITGTGTLTKLGSQRLSLLGTNTFVGSTLVSAGTLSAEANETLSDNSAVTIASGATLALRGFNETVRSMENSGSVVMDESVSTRLRVVGDLTNRSNGVWRGGAATIDITGTATNEGNFDLAGSVLNAPTFLLRNGTVNSSLGSLPSSSNGRLNVASSINLESGQINVPIAGTGGLIKSTTGSVRLLRTNSYNGATSIAAGELFFDVDGGLPSTTTVRIDSAGRLSLGETSQEIVSIDVSGTLQLGATDRSRLSVRGLFRSDDTSRLSLGASTLLLGGDWSSSGNVNAGTSTLEFVAPLGSLQRVAMSGSGSAHNMTHSGSGQLLMNSGIGIDGTLQKIGNGTLDFNGHQMASRQLIVDGGLIRGVAGSRISSSGVYDLRQGTIEVELAGATGLNKTTVGTIVLRSPVSYPGNTLISQGTLRMEDQATFPSDASLQIDPLGLVSIGNATNRIRSVSNSGTIVLPDANSSLFVSENVSIQPNAKVTIQSGSLELQGGFSNLGTVDVGQGTLVFASETGSQSFNFGQGILTGSGTLAKRGAGLLSIQGDSSFGGDLRVENGTVGANARLPNASTIVQSGGSLHGSASFDRLQVNQGGVVSPGNSPGSLTVNQLALNQGSELRMEVGGPGAGKGYDQIVVRDQALLNGTVAVTLLDDYRPKPGEAFDLITYQSRSGEIVSVLPKVNGVEMLRVQSQPNAYRLIGAQIAPPPPIVGPVETGGGESTSPGFVSEENDGATRLVRKTPQDEEADNSASISEDSAVPQDVSWYEAPVDQTSLGALSDEQNEIDQRILDTIHSAGLSLDLMAVASDIEPVKSKPSDLPLEPILRMSGARKLESKKPEQTTKNLVLEDSVAVSSAKVSLIDEPQNKDSQWSSLYLPLLLTIGGGMLSVLGGAISLRSYCRSVRTRFPRNSNKESSHGQRLAEWSPKELVAQSPHSITLNATQGAFVDDK